jgi:hypothetical protein
MRFIQVVCETTGIRRKLRNKINKNTQTSSTEVPRYLWNKLSTIPTSLFSSSEAMTQHIGIVK